MLGIRGEGFECAHVVEPICEFDEYDADVFGGGEDDLADIFCSALFSVLVNVDVFCGAFDKVEDLFSEFFEDCFWFYSAVFNGVMQDSCSDGGGVEPKFS